MSEHRYILEPYKGMNTRYRCPSCQHKDKTFSLYIDTETGEHVSPNVGRCNRESNCGHHYTPKQYFHDNNISFNTPQSKAYNLKTVTPQPKPVSYISVEVFKASLKGNVKNHFVKFLIDLFGVEVTGKLISRYFIATSSHWEGSTIFWQIDTHGNVRTGKIMLYSPITGKRVKEPFNHISWVHKDIKQSDFELKQCLFGEHLLIDKTKPIAIVESEKTAIIASVYLPQFIWLAVGSLSNLSAEKCNILKGRTVTLFPDLNGFDKWNAKVKELSNIAVFAISDLLERKATEMERKQGLDLADYLIKFDIKAFALTEPIEQPPPFQTLAEIQQCEHIKPIFQLSKAELQKTESWQQDISELENYFTKITIPIQPVKLNQSSTITNFSVFIKSHLDTVKANNGKRTFLPYLNRLQELKQVLTTNLY